MTLRTITRRANGPALLSLIVAAAAARMAAAAAPLSADTTAVRVLRGDAPAPAVAGGLYTPNRAPLRPTAFLKLPVGSITPQGWLRHQLVLDANGLCGRMPEVSDYLKFAGNGWVDPKSNTGWEEVSYWLRGYGDLGDVLGDARIQKEARRWIDGILTSQRPDGWFGPENLRTSLEGGPDMWPHMPILNALQSYYEYTGDKRVLSFLTRYFRFQNAQPGAVFHRSWAGVRWGDNLETVYWLYNRTGDAFLLDLAKKIHENSADYVSGMPTWHNVNIAEGFREPAEYWLQGKDAGLRDATYRDYDTVMERYGQFPGGGFAGDENCRPGIGDPRQGFETCGIVEFMHSFEMLTTLTGDSTWADRCEDLAFNSLPAALDPQHKGIHYITSANSIRLDDTPKGHDFSNDWSMQPYEPGIHNYRCCPHNYGMGWPYYAENLWLATADRGLCAALYAASTVRAKVAGGSPVRITETTDYPFGDTVRLSVAAAKPARFPLYLRIPRWSGRPEIRMNGRAVSADAGPSTYVVLERTWKSGDSVTLRLPMRVAVRTWTKNHDSTSVNYGPLTFSLAIPEKWERIGGTDAWPKYAVLPAANWNYGLGTRSLADPAKAFTVVRTPGPLPDQPFTPDAAPIRLKTVARRVPGWTEDRKGVVGTLQQSPARTDAPNETVTLIPMGAARLRITAFPTVSSGPDAHLWQAAPAPLVRASASHCFASDDVDAMDDGQEPANSNDQSIARFTWWDHKGTAEWVQYDLPQPKAVSAVSVYWFDDRTTNGGCRVPAAWRLLYKDGDTWKPVEGVSAYGTDRDRYNRVTFTPVNAAAFRIEAQLQDGFSSGILEWKLE